MVGLSLFGCEVNILTNLHIVHWRPCLSTPLLYTHVSTIAQHFAWLKAEWFGLPASFIRGA